MKMGIPEHEIGKKEIEAKRKTVLIQDFKLRKDSNDPERRNSTTPILDQMIFDMIAKKKDGGGIEPVQSETVEESLESILSS